MSSQETICAWLIPQPGGPELDPLEVRFAPTDAAPSSARGSAAKASAGRGSPLAAEVMPSSRVRLGPIIGRHGSCDLRLPPDEERVSRLHAQFMVHSGRWSIVDLGSRWGTQVNGVRLEPQQPMALVDGDLIRIRPWTFRFSTQGIPRSGPLSVDDLGTTIIRACPDQLSEQFRQDFLKLLLEGSSALMAAADLAAIAVVLVDLAGRGTKLANAAVVEALDADGHIQILASNAPAGQAQAMSFSRSLLAAASEGIVAEISADVSHMNITQSISRSNVTAAICAPLMVGDAVAAYLYLDSRGAADGGLDKLPANTSGFCQALARMGGLALANLKRIEMQVNNAAIECELASAADAQRWILPQCPITVGPFSCDGHCRPSGYIGGDFFDAQALPDGRMVVSLGDVCGHGIAASILMSATQGFLQAALAVHGDLARAVTDLNAFVYRRSPRTQYLTLWIGVLDPGSMSVIYVDAGHGLGQLIDENQKVKRLRESGGLPVGIEADYKYSTITAPLPPHGGLLIISDGIIEQSDGKGLDHGERKRFGYERVEAAVQSAPWSQLIGHLFTAVQQFANEEPFTDDATAVLVRWD